MAIVSIFIPEPQFQGQTKDRLNNPEAQTVVDSVIRAHLEQWMNNNRSIAESIVARIIAAARAGGITRSLRIGFSQVQHIAGCHVAGQAERLPVGWPRGF